MADIGLFQMYDTHGLPLGVQLMIAKSRGTSVDVPRFYRDALAAGWTEDRAARAVEEALSDVGQPRTYINAALEYLRG